MSTINDGGPAFPFEAMYTDGTHYHSHPGMALRDYFAAKALPTCIKVCVNDYPREGTYQEHCAVQAYKMADAMLRARGNA